MSFRHIMDVEENNQSMTAHRQVIFYLNQSYSFVSHLFSTISCEQDSIHDQSLSYQYIATFKVIHLSQVAEKYIKMII